MNSQQFDDIIKNSARKREADVPADIWEGISKKKKKRRFPFFWFILLGLLVGGGAIVWNLTNKNTPVQTVTIEKTNEGNKNNTVEKITAKNEAVVTENNNQEEKNSGNSDKITARQTNTSSVDKNNTANNIATGNPIVSAPKEEKYASNNDDHQKSKTENSDLKNEDSFVKNKTRHKTKGNGKINIIVGEMADNEKIAVENLFATNSNNKKTKNKTKIAIIAPAFDSGENIYSANSNTIPETTTNEFPEPAAKGSLAAKNGSLITTDSSILTKKEPIASVLKKPAKKSKRNGVKIEFGFTAISPIQQYNKPLYVKRTSNTSNIQNEFISKEIKTTVEPGAGFNIVIVKELNKKWSAGAGLQYLRFTELLHLSGTDSHKTTRIVQRLVSDPAGAYLKPDTLSVITVDSATINGRNIYSNFSIPVFVRYDLISRKKWALSFTGGVYIDLLRKYHNSLPGKFETMYASGIATDFKSTIGVDLFMGLHFSGILWKKMEWFAEPGFRYSLSNYSNNNLPFNKKIHKPGISLGIKFPLK